MDLTKEIKASIDKSVLCWLATVSAENIPNVSPKEIFNYFGTDEIIIANIASPQTVRNIRQNANVCVSFIDIFVQKGFQIKGKADIIEKSSSDFLEREKTLAKLTGGKFPFVTITKITISQVKPIIAPKYMLYPDTTESEQIENAKITYGF
jgi:predicted pyridoxine 5'-phosphate oxidase superfamily flavin-nucleotide-binding protein